MAITLGSFTFNTLTAQPYGFEELEAYSGLSARAWRVQGLCTQAQWASITNTYATWAAANAGGKGAALDSNNNGIPNGVEYFTGATAAKPATMPVVVIAGGVLTWTWPYDSAAVATYKFQLADDLSHWTDVAPPDARISVSANPNLLRLTLPAGASRKFCRLVVTPVP